MNRLKLRAKTLSNNLVWLESFGCTIKRRGKLISVDHPKLREFSACLIVENDEENLATLRSILYDAAIGRTPDVYLDHDVETRSIEQWLVREGFQPVLTSIVTAAAIQPENDGSGVSLERAALSQRSLWCAMYSEGFGRSDEISAAADRERWAETFLSDEVNNWFMVLNGQRIGVCQTCTANDVVGLYSFTLLPSERGVSNAMLALSALRNKFVSDGERIVYFERTQVGRHNRKVEFPAHTSIARIREYTGYRRSL